MLPGNNIILSQNVSVIFKTAIACFQPFRNAENREFLSPSEIRPGEW